MPEQVICQLVVSAEVGLWYCKRLDIEERVLVFLMKGVRGGGAGGARAFCERGAKRSEEQKRVSLVVDTTLLSLRSSLHSMLTFAFASAFFLTLASAFASGFALSFAFAVRSPSSLSSHSPFSSSPSQSTPPDM